MAIGARVPPQRTSDQHTFEAKCRGAKRTGAVLYSFSLKIICCTNIYQGPSRLGISIVDLIMSRSSSRPQCSLLTQLRTTHIGLNAFLYRFHLTGIGSRVTSAPDLDLVPLCLSIGQPILVTGSTDAGIFPLAWNEMENIVSWIKDESMTVATRN
jgi:hypothetical protein